MLAAAMSLVGCAGEAGLPELGTTSQGVMGGRVTLPCEWPAVVGMPRCTGVLVHPRLIVYAAHCGTSVSEVSFGLTFEEPALLVPTSHCEAMPGAKLGDGTDLAYCVLARPVDEVEPARILAGCELASLTPGQPAWIVGFGADRPGGIPGTKRVASTRISSLADELLLDSAGTDTCPGDSGGPLFIQYGSSEAARELRLVGITSAGSEEQCGTGTSHYVNLTRKIDWLEQSSGVDVTPCFDGGTWSPTADCVAVTGMRAIAPASAGTGPTARLDCERIRQPTFLDTCGNAFDKERDDDPPSLTVTAPAARLVRHTLEAGQTYVGFEVTAEASDPGWGIQQVSFSLLGARGEVLVTRIDEVAPYALPILRVPGGQFTLSVQARDHAGNTTTSNTEIEVVPSKARQSSSACGIVNTGASSKGSALLVLAVTCLLCGRGVRPGGGRERRRRGLRAARRRAAPNELPFP